MASVEPVTCEPTARGGDLGVALAVVAFAGLDSRRHEVVLLQAPGELGRDPRALAELAQIELCPRLAERGRAFWCARCVAARVDRVLDHSERQELVALHAQDRLEALDVRLREQPIPAARPPGPQETLILEVADLRDRDVGKLRPQQLAHCADRVQARGCERRIGGRAHGSRNVIRYLPTCTSSSAWSSALSIRCRFTNVPLRLPRSRIVNVSPSCTISAWRRETVTSSRKT